MITLLLLATLTTPPELCADLCSDVAVLHYAYLLERGGYGRFTEERAGFLIREADGTLTMEPWPSFEQRRASYRGVIPQRVIAIVHTHPLSAASLSAHDRNEARRTGMPVLVVTPLGVTAALPDGTTAEIVKGRGWGGRGRVGRVGR